MLVVDSAVSRDLSSSAYNERRAQCEQAAADLGVGSLRDATLEALEERWSSMDDVVRRRARHVITENARVLELADALRSGDRGPLGGLLAASHESLRADFEVSTPELDQLVASGRRHPRRRRQPHDRCGLRRLHRVAGGGRGRRAGARRGVPALRGGERTTAPRLGVDGGGRGVRALTCARAGMQQNGVRSCPRNASPRSARAVSPVRQPGRRRRAAVRRGLPHRRRHRDDRLPRRPPRQAAARRGPGRRRQDRAGQGGGGGDGLGAHPPAVLRGPRRGARAVRVELQEAAAAHPGVQGRRARGTTSTTTSSPRSSCSRGRC